MAHNIDELLNDSNKYKIEVDDLLENSAVRVPICLCLDTSGSMDDNNKIGDLNEGISDFIKTLLDDDVACDAAELCIIQMGGDAPKVICDFEPLYKVAQHEEIGNFVAMGRTPMGQAVEMGIRSLNERKARYKATSTDYYQPWLVIMSDGVSTDSSAKMQEAQDFVLSLVEAKKLVCIPIVIGNKANGIEQLSNFTVEGSAFTLDSVKIKEFFRYLSMSVSRVSCSGQTAQKDPKEILREEAKSVMSWVVGSAERHLS